MRLTLFGDSAWRLEAAAERELIDPYPVNEDARKAITGSAASCDLVLVSHGAVDHRGIAIDVVRDSATMTLITEPATAHLATRSRYPRETRAVHAVQTWQ